MKRFFLHLSFLGTNYRGWQNQPNVTSVQEVLETALRQILKEKTNLIGCGRTDAGVHASQFYAHFDTAHPLDFDLKFRLNKVLPDDISILELIPVAEDRNARFHAAERTYRYFFHTHKNALLHRTSTLYDQFPLDFEKMKFAISLLAKHKEYLAFCKTPEAHPSTRCLVKSASLNANDNQTEFCFEITASRFLRGMIRNLMARIFMIGNGELSIEHFELLLKNEIQEQLPPPAPPQGLFLSKVVYDFL